MGSYGIAPCYDVSGALTDCGGFWSTDSQGNVGPAGYGGPSLSPGTTVTPNPSVPNMTTASSASELMQMGSTMAQWGATIASAVTGNPPVSTASGVRVVTVNNPAPAAMSSTTMLLLLAAGVVVLLLVMKKI